MLPKRILFAGAAGAAALAIAIPAAYADPPTGPGSDDQRVWTEQAPADKAPEKAPGSTAEQKSVPEDHKAGTKSDTKSGSPSDMTYESKSESKSEGKSEGKDSGKETKAEGSWADKAPHGGVHTGGGGIAVSGSGLATGAALLAGGLGVGTVALRRRRGSEA
ncbi:hypothetical protein [Streptomyces sp. NRRL B-24484]|uniref:hypothetical protein n=1 Tax=Streptomyces sp. NRRL B-24484 TaxID=1463833 RepID=UPI0004BF0AB1|nr:hypothetical protein [Streptomyces sp. NRRL B-24484]